MQENSDLVAVICKNKKGKEKNTRVVRRRADEGE